MTEQVPFLDMLNNEIDANLQFVDYAETKVNKRLEKKDQPATQHFAINKALLALEEEQNKATYTALLNLLVVQLDAYLALSDEQVAAVFRAEIVAVKETLAALIKQVADSAELA